MSGAFQTIYIRESATVIPGPVPEHYDFLKAPAPVLLSKREVERLSCVSPIQ
jgi:hypothetical protein